MGEVDLAPAQPEHLAPAHPRRRHEQPGCIQPVALDVRQECAELLGAPRLHLGRRRLGGIGPVRRVPGEVAPAHGVVESLAEHRVDVAHRPSREGLGRGARLELAPAALEEVGVGGIQVGRGEVRELPAADRRHDVGLDDPAVVVPGHRPDGRPPSRQPLVHEEPRRRQRAALDVLARADLSPELVEGVLGDPAGRDALDAHLAASVVRAGVELDAKVPARPNIARPRRCQSGGSRRDKVGPRPAVFSHTPRSEGMCGREVLNPQLPKGSGPRLAHRDQRGSVELMLRRRVSTPWSFALRKFGEVSALRAAPPAV